MEEQRTYKSKKGRLPSSQMIALANSLECDVTERGISRKDNSWLYSIPISVPHHPNRELLKEANLILAQ
jgi:hypothetical protein